MLMRPWWENEPDRLDREIEALKNAGYSCEKDEDAFLLGAGAFFVEATLRDGEMIRLKIRFPNGYPHFKPDVIADGITLAHHQTPHGRLCMSGGVPEKWGPDRLVADFLDEYLQLNIDKGRGIDIGDSAKEEINQAEPRSVYFSPYQNKQKIVLWGDVGRLSLSADRGPLVIGMQKGSIDQFAVREWHCGSGCDTKFSELPEGFLERYSVKTGIKGYWLKVSETPDLRYMMGNFFPFLKSVGFDIDRFIKNNETLILAIVFSEETSWRHSDSDGCIFFEITLKKNKKDAICLSAQRCSRSILSQRVPLFDALQNATVAIAGLGCLGAPLSLELAKSGVGKLHLLDPDTVEFGTSVRYPFGLSSAGVTKVAALQKHIKENYPYSRVMPFELEFGTPPSEDGRFISTRAETLAFLEGVDLVIDATANMNVNGFLSDLSRNKGIPYICLSATYGLWGGRVLRVRPDGCWSCYRYGIHYETVPEPINDEKAVVQPLGCSSPTFQGAGFDGMEVSMMATRLAVSTLTDKFTPGLYPSISWDGAIVNMRDQTGGIIPPSWTTFNISKHPECKSCLS